MEIDKSIIGEVTSEPVDASKVASDLTRANHVIERIYKAVEQPQNIAFFTHENMMRFVIMTLEKKPVNEGYRVDVDFCDVYAINNIGGTLTIKMLRF
jgi:broad specificity phosphatase PhoE